MLSHTECNTRIEHSHAHSTHLLMLTHTPTLTLREALMHVHPTGWKHGRLLRCTHSVSVAFSLAL